MTSGLLGRPRQSGSLLIITLWLVTILSVLAVAIARYLSLELRLVKYHIAREQANVLARSGVYLAMRRLQDDIQQPGQVDWLGDMWALPWDDLAIEGDHVHVASIVDDERKLNLNAIDSAQLADQLGRLFGPDGVTPSLVAYLTPVNPTTDDATTSPPYVLKHGPVATLDELLDLPGMKDVFGRVQQLTVASTPSAPPPKVNINTAERDVLVAMGGAPDVVEALVGSRPGADGKLGTPDDCLVADVSDVALAAKNLADCAHMALPLRQELVTFLSLPTVSFGVTSSIFHIQVTAEVGPQHLQRHIEAVVKRTSHGEQILLWKEG